MDNQDFAEKTGMSESYLTHIKNGTRRWNEDSLRKLANAFEMSPIELFAQRRKRTDDIDNNVSMPEKSDVQLKVQIVPVVGDIPSNPSPYNNQLMQLTTGFKDVFVPVLNTNDGSMFAFSFEVISLHQHLIRVIFSLFHLNMDSFR